MQPTYVFCGPAIDSETYTPVALVVFNGGSLFGYGHEVAGNPIRQGAGWHPN